MRETPVYLIGAGPGDPGLITVRARDLLSRADIIIYDYLANSVLLKLARADAKTIFVGKKGFSAHVTQGEINECLVEQARQNPNALIVRCKGGDPFVFGRGGEEALALRKANIPFEVVPGITAGVAAPAYAGIPVTYRGIASSMAFVTGHETPEKNESAINWDHLANGVDTICFYMGMRNLPLIANRLMQAGRAPSTPVALVRWGSLPAQTVLTATLDTVVEKAQAENFQAPAIIVVGEVVRLREELSWFENRPLAGRRIVVTRAATQASDTVAQLTTLGAEVIGFPTIAIESLASSSAAATAARSVNNYDWVVFTSANGVEEFFSALDDADLDARAFGSARICAIGPATRSTLLSRGIRANLMPESYVAESAAEALIATDVSGKRVLLARAESAREVLPERLRAASASVDVVAFYRTVPGNAECAQNVAEQLQAGRIDAITFTSSSTATNCVSLLADAVGSRAAALALLQKTNLFSIGPITSETLLDFGLTPASTASEFSIDGLVATLRKEL